MTWDHARAARKDRRGGHNRKITSEQREEILRLFFAEGEPAAMALATSHGLSPLYARKLASERGMLPFPKRWYVAEDRRV